MSKFCFIPIVVSSKHGIIQDAMEDLIKSRLRSKRYFRRFAEVPITPKTLVLRIDTTKNAKKFQVFEVAHSKYITVNDKKELYYRSSHFRANSLEFVLSL